MRRLIPLLVVVLFVAPLVTAQQATLSSPVTPPTENNYRTESQYSTRDSGGRWEATVSVRDSGGVELRRITFSGPDSVHPGATAIAYTNAIVTVRGGETGGNARKVDFRIIGFLSDQGYLPPVTLVP